MAECTSLERNRLVTGMLLYSKTNEDNVLEQKYQMSGNVIAVRALGLNMEFSESRKEL